MRAAGCHLYLVGLAATDDVTIWVSEVWESKESHDAYMKELLFYTQIAENFYDNYLLGKMRNKT